jgi:hypothetical protein
VRDSGIKDFFDLADKLLDPASIAETLATLSRPTLATLAVAAEIAARVAAESDAASGGSGILPESDVDARLTQLGAPTAHFRSHLETAVALALADGATPGLVSIYSPVVDEILSWQSVGLPSVAELAQHHPAALEVVSDHDLGTIDAQAAESAFALTTAVGELLAELTREPARELSRGGLALPDSRRIASATARELEDVPSLVALSQKAGLVDLEGGVWLTTPNAAPWMLLPTIERWASLAASWLDGVAPEMRDLLAARSHSPWGENFIEFAGWLYPAGGEWIRERIATYGHNAERLGIVSSSVPSSAGSALLADGPTAAAKAFAPLFPAEVSKVYVQHDLTIVSPGPLEPRVDARLREFTTVESRALAATYRVSAGSIAGALASGQTAESITEFLTEISLTGIPQPLEYVIADTAARHGLVRVGEIAGGDGSGPSYIRSTDSSLLGTILVDHSLFAVRLTRVSDSELASRFPVDTVVWALADAKYPAAAEDAAGQIMKLDRRRTARSTTTLPTDPAVVIVERLRLLGTPSAGANDRAWLERQLEVAIKTKTAVRVTVAISDDSEVEYVVHPTSIAGGRLRALDRTADIERTLPLSRIVAVTGAV